MKTFFPILLSTLSLSSAATIDTSYVNPGTDGTAFPYELLVTLDVNDSWSSVTSVGGWSYVNLDPSKDPSRGWGHASTWYLIEITEATRLEVTISLDVVQTMTSTGFDETTALSSAHPGFVIYAGESVEDAPSSLHSYSNDGGNLIALNDAWDNNGTDGSPGLIYVFHAFSAEDNTVTGWVDLEPGRYTIAVGNGADANLAPSDKVYQIAFATVPEPSALLLGALTGLALLRRQR
ncbi:hypothetical protein HNR46_002052 [Haloferula luteola]|uniref:PEP-CTERM protein-sorting domain-containing protein n=1 Tax=Haloferula luteola TaxID=595692 RepID=A0A840V2W1_9BACT|nr:hypothetical protein [Haloferula luteola]MBB5351813.1 hypothetical protein [Haloferula luteola]